VGGGGGGVGGGGGGGVGDDVVGVVDVHFTAGFKKSGGGDCFFKCRGEGKGSRSSHLMIGVGRIRATHDGPEAQLKARRKDLQKRKKLLTKEQTVAEGGEDKVRLVGGGPMTQGK